MLRQIFNDYFTFSRVEQRGFRWLVLLILIVSFLPLAFRLLGNGNNKHIIITERPADEDTAKPEGIDSLFIHKTNLFRFDPNTVQRHSLIQLGLSPAQADQLINYRNSGGRFYARDDLLKLYSLSKEDYLRLRKYIKISRDFSDDHNDPKYEDSRFRIEPEPISLNLADISAWQSLPGIGSVLAERIVKYRTALGGFSSKNQLLDVYGIDSVLFQLVHDWVLEDSVVSLTKPETYKTKRLPFPLNLNHADSAALCSLPGIGPVFSQRIIGFRTILGGFYAAEQLKEVYGLTDETFILVEDKIRIDTTQIQKINLNTASFDQLNSHPYISGSLARFIISFRNKSPFRAASQIQESFLVDAVLWQKLKYYLATE